MEAKAIIEPDKKAAEEISDTDIGSILAECLDVSLMMETNPPAEITAEKELEEFAKAYLGEE